MDPVCYRHPDLRAGVACQRCERPICPDCMTPASVGFHCPDCVRRSGQKIYKASDLRTRPIVTYVLIGINAIVFTVGVLAAGASAGGDRASALLVDYGLWGPAVSSGEWYRVFTGGFLHNGVLHFGFNVYLLWALGLALEPVLGSVRFLLAYLAGLVGASFAIMLLAPAEPTVGASGAIFGLAAVALVADRHAGIDPWRSGIAPTIAGILLITFLIPGISIAGHLGGLLGGVVAGFVLIGVPGRAAPERWGPVLCAAFILVCAVGSVLAAQAAYPGLV